MDCNGEQVQHARQADPISREQAAQIGDAKHVIYASFKSATEAGVPKQRAGILVDEQFGTAILRDAAATGFITACPAEKSEHSEFDFEYGEDFAAHIEDSHPILCRVLVSYNPEGNPALNQRQADSLRRISHYLQTANQSRLRFECRIDPSKEKWRYHHKE